MGKSVQAMLSLLSEQGDPRADKTAGLDAAAQDAARHAVEVLLGEHDGGERRERHTRETLKETLVNLARFRY